VITSELTSMLGSFVTSHCSMIQLPGRDGDPVSCHIWFAVAGLRTAAMT